MASHLPLPQPPRTPSPLSDDDPPGFDPPGFVLNASAMESSSSLAPYDPNSLFPSGPPSRAMSVSSTASTSENKPVPNPFGFEPQEYIPGRRSPTKNIGQRRGHRYKHSSVSHQIILEPTPRPPLRLPASLPIPNVREAWYSMSTEQTVRLAWCVCHLSTAAFVQWTAQGSLAMTALSHLIFYDAIGALLCTAVEVLANFEVWSRSSVRHPFGLERTEVLVGFAMSILLLFMGFDIISHGLGHLLADVGDHEAHHGHVHASRVSSGNIHVIAAVAVASTLVSALMLSNHARIARSLRFAYISFLPSFLTNPSHLLTISCSALLLLMPFLSLEMYNWLDTGLAATMAFLMCALGVQLVKTLGAMLLMSYRPSNDGEIVSVLQDIEADPNVTAIDEAKFWQVHYGLAMANIKLRVRGGEDSLRKLRDRVQALVRRRLGGGYGADAGLVWEVSTQLTLDAN